MDNLTHLGCRASMLFYDARRSDFLVKLRDNIDKLESLKKRCDRCLRCERLEELRGARAEVLLIDEEAQRLVISFRRSKKQQSDRIKELLGEDRARISVSERSEVDYFLVMKRNGVERLRREQAEENSLVEEFVRLTVEVHFRKKLWYSQDQDDPGYQEADKMTFIFGVDQLEKEAHKEQPWYEVKED